MSKVKIFALVVLLVASFSTTLWNLSFVNSVIFDEVHFGKFVTAYCCTHERFFDIHPPHAKLLIAATAYLAGYRGGFDFKNIGEEYTNISVIPLRLLPALAGALIPLVAYGLLRTIGVSWEFSFLGSLALALDNALTTQSRVIGLDSILLLTTFASIWFFLLWLTTKKGSTARMWLLVGSGATAGLAVGTKFTGLAALAIIGVTLLLLIIKEFWQAAVSWRKQVVQYVIAGLTILGVAFVIYALGWIIHVKILTQPGSGDAWGARTGHLVADIIQEHKTMFEANYNLKATHPYSSFWWTWPAMVRPVFYWSKAGAWVYFIGNPLVWWGSIILFVIAVVHYLLDKDMRRRAGLAAVLLLGYVLSFLPFVHIPRALFLYHYLTPLVFSLLFGLWWLDTMLPQRYKKNVVIITSILLLVGFIVFSPLTYGFDGWQQSLMWFHSWR